MSAPLFCARRDQRKTGKKIIIKFEDLFQLIFSELHTLNCFVWLIKALSIIKTIFAVFGVLIFEVITVCRVMILISFLG